MEALGLNGDAESESEAEDDVTDDQPAAKKQKVSAEEVQEIQQSVEEQVLDDVSLDNRAYLKSQLRYKPGILLDSSDNAVMMDWETQIMQRHAETLIPKSGLKVMNVGHGMGIVDTAIQSHDPAEHHIIEAHPQVHQRLREQGWYDKPNVHIHEGRWQDILPKLVEQGVVLDAIYYDTFAEDYAALKEFFAEYVVQLLAKDGKFGWYNGLGADRQICYDVYTKVRIICSDVFGKLTVRRLRRWISTKLDSTLYGKTSKFRQVCTIRRTGRALDDRTGLLTFIGCRSIHLLSERYWD
jgi:protein arginine N-methyltransferase 2